MKKLHRFLAGTVLVIIALLVCFPIWFAVTGAFSSGWELKENLSPVFGDSQEMAQWSFLPKAPTLRSLVEVLLDRPEFYTMFWNSVKVSGSIFTGPASYRSTSCLGACKTEYSRSEMVFKNLHCTYAYAVSGTHVPPVSYVRRPPLA